MEYTERVLEAVEEGLLDRDEVIMACLKFMTEANVRAMCKANLFFEPQPEEE
jgi:hypothetical protein